MDPKELLNTRGSLLNARTQFLDWRKGPSALCPPGRSHLSIGAHHLAGPLAIIAGCLSLLHNVEGCVWLRCSSILAFWLLHMGDRQLHPDGHTRSERHRIGDNQ